MSHMAVIYVTAFIRTAWEPWRRKTHTLIPCTWQEVQVLICTWQDRKIKWAWAKVYREGLPGWGELWSGFRITFLELSGPPHSLLGVVSWMIGVQPVGRKGINSGPLSRPLFLVYQPKTLGSRGVLGSDSNSWTYQNSRICLNLWILKVALCRDLQKFWCQKVALRQPDCRFLRQNEYPVGESGSLTGAKKTEYMSHMHPGSDHEVWTGGGGMSPPSEIQEG